LLRRAAAVRRELHKAGVADHDVTPLGRTLFGLDVLTQADETCN
jgi:hypothetical protein